MSFLKRAAVGFASGAAATLPMTVVFIVGRRARRLDEIPPHKAIRSVAPKVPEPALTWTSPIAHLLVGALAGAAYGLLLPTRVFGVGSGAVWGIVVWLAGYEVVMPAATDIAPAHRDRRDRAWTIFGAHIVFGAVLGFSARKASKGAAARPAARRE